MLCRVSEYTVTKLHDYCIHVCLDSIHIYFILFILYFFIENDGLVCKLLKACPNEPEPIPFKELEIERDSLVLSDKLGAGNFGEVFKGWLLFYIKCISLMNTT